MTSYAFGTKLLSSYETKTQFNNLFLFEPTSKKKLITLPSSFDGSVVWKNYIQPINNQGNCESCWAFASIFTLATRISIYTQGKYKLNLSYASMIFSDVLSWEETKKQLLKGKKPDRVIKDNKPILNSCKTQSLLYAWQFLYRFGVPEDSCVKSETRIQNIYSQEQVLGSTYDRCIDLNNEYAKFHRSDGYYYVPGTLSKASTLLSGSEETIRREIYKFGPCSTVMKVFDDFLSWDGHGIYKWGKTSKVSSSNGHSVVLMGWGEDEGVKYWIVRNSWGKSWGNGSGYFKIVRGINNCEIDRKSVV